MFALLGGKSDQHRGTGAVEARTDMDAHRFGQRGRRRHVAVQVDDHRRPGVQPHQPEPVDLRELGEKVPGDTLIGDRLAVVGRLKQARVKVTVDALQQMTVLRESSITSLAFPGYAVDLAMMLVLLGTFFGLCLMLLQMQGVVPGAG